VRLQEGLESDTPASSSATSKQNSITPQPAPDSTQWPIPLSVNAFMTAFRFRMSSSAGHRSSNGIEAQITGML
jgi:hypothetical protein